MKRYLKFIPVVKKNFAITTGRGHYIDRGDYADVKMFVKVETNIPDSEFAERGWAWSHSGSGIEWGKADDVNKPFYSVTNEFENPFNVFSAKGKFFSGANMFLGAKRDGVVGDYNISRVDISRLYSDPSFSEALSKTIYLDEEPVTPPEPIVPPDPIPDIPIPESRDLIITFIKGNWFIAALQSMLFWKKITRIWTHVQIGFSDSKEDMSAEKKGMEWVNRQASIEKARDSISLRLKIILREDAIVTGRFLEDRGKKYDFFLYPRWFFNVTIPHVLLGMIPMLIWGKIVPYAIAIGILYIPVNMVLYFLSKARYACSKHVSSVLADIGVDFRYYGKFHTASPTDMYEKIMFARQRFDIKVDENIKKN